MQRMSRARGKELVTKESQVCEPAESWIVPPRSIRRGQMCLIILSASTIGPITRSTPKNLNVYFVSDSGKKVSNTYPFSAPYFFATSVKGHFIPLATKTMKLIPMHSKATSNTGPK